MTPVDFDGANVTLVAPPGAEDILPLRVRVTRHGVAHKVTQSMWRPSPEDIENLMGGGLVMLSFIIQGGHPPCKVEVVAPQVLAAGG